MEETTPQPIERVSIIVSKGSLEGVYPGLIMANGARMEGIETEAGQTDHRPSVACIEWIDPLMAAGNWMPELVTLAGGESLFGEIGAHSPWLDWETLR